MYTKLIMGYLNVPVEVALRVQYIMECSGLDFSESSDRTLKRAAKQAYEELKGKQ